MCIQYVTMHGYVFITLVLARIVPLLLLFVILLLLFRIQISTECHSVMLENNKPNTPNLNLNLPESVNECKRDIKLYLLMQPCYVNLREFELFCQTVVSRIHTGSASPL